MKPTQEPVKRWMDEETLNIYRVEFYSAIKNNNVSIMQSLHQRLSEYCRIVEGKIQKSEDWDIGCEIVSSIYDRGAAPMKSQQYSCPDKTCIMAIPVNTPMSRREISQGSTSS